MEKVKNGVYVQVHYQASLEDGTVFDNSEGREPLEFQVGSGSIISGFNDAILGMALNESKEVTLNPEQAYGQPQDEAKREFPKEMLGDHQIEVGQELAFSTPRGPVNGKVLEIGENTFRVDFNHPLAGKTLKFTVRVAGISDQPTQRSCACSAPGCGPDCG